MSSTHTSVSKNSLDVAVVGAGLSGLLTARLLHDHFPNKLNVSIFERDPSRLGGRIQTIQDGQNGVILEAGAEFVNEDHHLMRELCDSLEIELLDSYSEGQTAPRFGYFSNNNLRTEFAQLATKLKEAVQRDQEASQSDDHTCYNFAKMSAADYISQLGLSPDDTELLKLFVHTEQAVKIGKMSALFLLQWMDFEGFEDGHNSLFAQGDDRYRIKGGSRAIIDALAEPLHSHIETSRPIIGVFEGSYKVRLTANDHLPTYVDAVVLALPASVVSRMDVSDGTLQRMKARNSKIRYSSVSKTLLSVFEHLPWALQHCNQVLNATSRALIWGTGQNLPKDRHLSHIAVYQGGDNVGHKTRTLNAHEVIESSLHQLYRQSQSKLRHDVKPPILGKLVTYGYPDGGWTNPTLGRGGDLAAFRRNLKRSYERVILCGEHLATENPETMQGAAESAVRAVREVANVLSLPFPDELKLPSRD
jgi:monoamine oxidase